MKRLGNYLRLYLKESILAPLFKMLEAFFELMIPIVVARIIDNGIPAGDVSYILKHVALMALLGAVGFASALSAQYFAAKCAAGIGAGFRRDLFRHINTLGYAQIDAAGTSALITRMTSDINQIQNAVNMFLRLFLRSPIIVIGASICACAVGKKTDPVYGITVPSLFALVFVILIITMPLNAKVQQVLERITLSVRENLSGVRVIRAFNRQQNESEEFKDRSAQLYGKQLACGGISGLLNPLAYAAINTGVVAIIYIGGREVYDGTLTRGTVVALVNYMTLILTEIIKLANLIILESRGLASLKRVNELFAVEDPMKYGTKEPDISRSAEIVFDHVTFRYGEGAAPAVDDVSFRIPPGSTVGIIGGTGAGKTTLVNLMTRFYDAQEGEILLGGTPVKEIGKSALIKNIAVVPQKAALFSGTLRRNLQVADQNATEEEMYAALQTAVADEFVRGKGRDLNMEIEEGGVNLSGGQKQRLTIARALVKKAGLLILDDSSSALDYATAAALQKNLRETRRETTKVIVSQRIASVQDADQIIVMDSGRAVGIGTHGELYKQCPKYREICDTQLEAEAREGAGA